MSAVRKKKETAEAKSPVPAFWPAYHMALRHLSEDRTNGTKQTFLVFELLGMTIGQPEDERRLISKPITLTDLGLPIHCSKKHTGELVREFRGRGGLNRYNDFAAKMMRQKLRAVKDQQGYEEALEAFRKAKLDLYGWPSDYDPRWVKQIVEDLAAIGKNAQAYRYMLVPQNWATMPKCQPATDEDDDWEGDEDEKPDRYRASAQAKPAQSAGTIRSDGELNSGDPEPDTAQEAFPGWDDFWSGGVEERERVVGIHREIGNIHISGGISVGARGADLYISHFAEPVNKGVDEATVPPQAHSGKSSNTPNEERATLCAGLKLGGDTDMVERLYERLRKAKSATASQFVAFVAKKQSTRRKEILRSYLPKIMEEFVATPADERAEAATTKIGLDPVTRRLLELQREAEHG